MAGLEDLVKKAVYMGVGIASYATEKANVTLGEIRNQAQKLAEEMVTRGELTTEEARKFVDDLVKQAQQESVKPSEDNQSKEPRRIEILAEDEVSSSGTSEAQEDAKVDNLRQQVESLQEELRRLKKE